MARLLIPEPEPEPEPEPAPPEGLLEPSWNQHVTAPSNLARAIDAEAGRGARRPRDFWIIVPDRSIELPPPGCEFAIRVTDGRCYLARRAFFDGSSIGFEVVGTGRRMCVPRNEIAGCSPLRAPHTYSDRRLVLERQRAGSPGAFAKPVPHAIRVRGHAVDQASGDRAGRAPGAWCLGERRPRA
jgi:hypothetical protein